MKWFSNVSTLEELRKQYRQLMKKHHPDVGGSTENAKEINAEYERLFSILSRQEVTQEREEYNNPAEEDKAIRAILDALVTLNADVEIRCGNHRKLDMGHSWKFPVSRTVEIYGVQVCPEEKGLVLALWRVSPPPQAGNHS